MQTTHHEKIREHHLARQAVIYIRQSSPRQVEQHQESARVQYGLRERAASLGWKDAILIDEDLGKSAAYYSERSGFQHLVTRVSLGEVGIVLALEATRLARNNRDWYHLIDLCALFDTLIGDHEYVYDPQAANDRLLLGMKGTMSEAELNLIRARMRQGRLSKARRGDLHTTLPAGYRLDSEGRVERSADVREREVIELIFKKFRQLGSARQTHQWLIEEKILVPVNGRERDRTGSRIRWRWPNYSYVRYVLKNPFYAGAYVYGRRGTRVRYVEGRIEKTSGHFKPEEEWEVVLRDHHEGYLSWEEYQENVAVLRQNESRRKGDETVGAIRQGKALLAGLMRCGGCGRKMHVRYWGRKGTNARYLCGGEHYFGGRYCQAVSALRVDRMVDAELLKVVEPSAVEAGLRAAQVMQEKRQEKLKYRQRELEAAQYEAERAFTQYDEVDPLNRLVATELERRWNDKLEAVRQIGEQIDEESRVHPSPSEEEILQLRGLSHRLPEVWGHPQSDPRVKKRIIRLLIKEVLLLRDDQKSVLRITIHWQGGVHTQIEWAKPAQIEPPNKTQEEVVQLIGQLAPHYPDEEIARILNCHGYRTGSGNVWNRTRVRSLRSEKRIAPFDRKTDKATVTLNEAAKRLGVAPNTVRRFIHKGLIEAEQIVKHAPFNIPVRELDKPPVQKAVRRLSNGEPSGIQGGVPSSQLTLIQ